MFKLLKDYPLTGLFFFNIGTKLPNVVSCNKSIKRRLLMETLLMFCESKFHLEEIKVLHTVLNSIFKAKIDAL